MYRTCIGQQRRLGTLQEPKVFGEGFAHEGDIVLQPRKKTLHFAKESVDLSNARSFVRKQIYAVQIL